MTVFGRIVILFSSAFLTKASRFLFFLSSSDLAFEPIDLDIEPRLHLFNFKNNGHITIQISNVTTRTITIPPKAVICELQPVTIQPKPSQENQPVETSFLDKVEINKSLMCYIFFLV
jgi:hypothetical protein